MKNSPNQIMTLSLLEKCWVHLVKEEARKLSKLKNKKPK
jgi:hypothetical protein